MDPTWEETAPAETMPTRDPAQLTPVPKAAANVAMPTWADTAPVPQAAHATAGSTPSWDDTTDLQSEYGGGFQQYVAGMEGAARGALSFVAPPAEAALGSVWGIPGTSLESQRLRAEANEGTAAAGEGIGFGLAALGTMGESAVGEGILKGIGKFNAPNVVGKIGEGVKALTGLGGEGAGFLSKVAGKSVQLGTELAALQGGTELTKMIWKDPNQTTSNAMAHIGMSGALGTLVGLPLGAASIAWEKAAAPVAERILGKIKADWGMGEPIPGDEHIVAPLLKGALNMVGGVPKDVIESYAAQRELVNAAPEFSEVYGNVLDHLTEMQENLDTKKANLASAKAGFADFLKEQKLALKQAGYDAASAETLANEAFEKAKVRLGVGLQDGALESAPKAFSAVQKLRTQAMEMSQAARDILEKTDGELSLKPIFAAIRPMQDELYAKGFPAMAEDLGKTMDVFAHQHGDKISYANAKSMIQGLQQRGTWNMLANEIAQGTRPYYNQLSGIMNEALKDAVKPYRVAMEPTAKAFELLGKLDKYGSPESANKAVLGLKNVGNYTNEMPMLRDLEAKTGINFTHQLEHYANPVVRENMSKALPEYAKSLRTAEALQQLKDPETRAALERAPYLSQAHRTLTRAEQALQQQVELRGKLQGLTPATLESKMKSAMAGRGMAGRRALENVPGMGDLSIPEVLDLISTRQAFEKGAMNGSRNVNMAAKVLGGVGGLLGTIVGHSYEGAAIGTASGAAIGAYLDKNGPQEVKNVLDWYLNKYGDLPKAVGASPEATKAGLLHFLGRDVPPSAGAFKSAVNYIQGAGKGAKALKTGARLLFEGSKTLPAHIWDDKDKTEKLDEKAKKLQGNEQGMIDIGGGLGHYMPDHGQALAETSSRVVNYINANRPTGIKFAPLDEEMEPDTAHVRDFQRGLLTAQNPLSILQHVKSGTLMPDDLQHLNAMYPEYYQHMKEAVMSAMSEHLAKDGKIPYQLRQSLSLFLGETLDSSMSPQSIQSAQAVFQAQAIANQAANSPAKAQGAKKMEGVGKLAKSYQTNNQAAEHRRSQQKV